MKRDSRQQGNVQPKTSSHLVDYAWPIFAGILLAIIYLQYTALNKNGGNTEQAITGSFSSAASRAFPSVVKISTERTVITQLHPAQNDPFMRHFFQRRNRQSTQIARGLGSGVIVDRRGFILTNNHVINGADQITVTLSNGQVYSAAVVGIDEPTDLAVLKIAAENIIPIRFANPNSVHVGDIVLAIGNPYGIGQTVTQGIVSATGRYGLNLNTYENYIQTDAAINRGNSGGALVDINGELIGINSALYSKSDGFSGIGFAIPNDIAVYVLANILNEGSVRRGWLGVTAEEITPLLAQQYNLNTNHGLLITGLAIDGPADKAGLEVGDIITHINQEEISTGNMGMQIVAQTKPGEQINIQALRRGAAQSFLINITGRPSPNASN